MKRDHTPTNVPARRQAGVTLIEALVALLIMSFGMLALVGMQGNMRRSADLAKQRSEAVRLAQGDLERIRSFSALEPAADAASAARAYSQITDMTVDAGDPQSNAAFMLDRSVSQTADKMAVQVTVRWKDRTDEEMQVRLGTFISRVDPRLSGSLSIAPDGAPTRRPMGRDVSIPSSAKDVGDGRSIFKPPSSGSVAWVFNNLTGLVAQRCTGLPEGLVVADMSLDTIATYCNNTIAAYPISGWVRFSLIAPPNPELPVSPAVPLDMTLTLSSTGHPVPAYECFDNAPTQDNHSQTEGVAYHCLIYPSSGASPAWSGILQVGEIPLGNGGHKICRYSADYDRNGSISNAEHPLSYTQVTVPLTRQNFLVILATQTCPAGQDADPDAGRFFNSATVQHQP